MRFREGDMVFYASPVGDEPGADGISGYRGMAKVVYAYTPSLATGTQIWVDIELKENQPCLSAPSYPYRIGEKLTAPTERLVRVRKAGQ